jgi:hypothetical protein
MDEARVIQLIEALRKEVESHIQSHQMYVEGLYAAQRLVILQLIDSGSLNRETLEINFAAAIQSIKANDTNGTEHHRNGICSVLQSLLDQGPALPPRPSFSIIRGGKDEPTPP